MEGKTGADHQHILPVQGSKGLPDCDVHGGIQGAHQRHLDTGDIRVRIHDLERHEQPVVEPPRLIQPGLDAGTAQQFPDFSGHRRGAGAGIADLVGLVRKPVIVVDQWRALPGGQRRQRFFPVRAYHQQGIGFGNGRRNVLQACNHFTVPGIAQQRHGPAAMREKERSGFPHHGKAACMPVPA